jgi:hypothetical protein
MPGRFQLMSSLPICYIFSFVLLIFDQLINKHVFVLEIDIQILRHIFIIWCMRRRFSAVFMELWSCALSMRRTQILNSLESTNFYRISKAFSSLMLRLHLFWTLATVSSIFYNVLVS